MNDTSFIDLLSDDNIKKINIDPRLVESFKNVMIKMQEYFNKTGISGKINFKEMFENYLLSKSPINKEEILQSDEFKKYVDDIKKFYKEINVSDLENELDIEHLYNTYLAENGILSICVDKENRGAGEYRNNVISVSLNELLEPSEHLEHTICHEFIHHITMCGRDQYGSVSYNLPSFAYEALTEMITQDIVFGKQQDYFNEMSINGKNGNSYSQWCQLMRFINDYYGIQDYHAFLVQRSSDERYKDTLDKINEIVSEKFSSFNPNDRYVDNELLDKTQNIVIANMLSDIINSPNIDVSTFADKMLLFDKMPFKNLSETPSKMSNYIIDYYCNKNNMDKEKIAELLSTERKLKQYDGKDVFEFEQDSMVTIAFTKEGKVYKKVAGEYATTITEITEDDYFSPYYIDQQNHTIHFFSEKGSFDYDLNSIDFSKRRNELLVERDRIVENLNRSIGKENITEERIKEEATAKAQEIDNREKQLQAEKQRQIQHNMIISQVEQMLSMRITDTSGYIYDSETKTTKAVKKDTNQLSQELGQVHSKIDKLFYEGEIDSKLRSKMHLEVINQYNSMIANAPKPTIPTSKVNDQAPTSSVDDYTETELFEEDLPYGAKKEEQKASSFPKFKPLEQAKHQDFVQQSSKHQESKSKFQNMDDKKKEQESQKRKENIEDLKRMQEMVEIARQQKMQQDFMNNQEEMEEDQGMSL